MLDSTLPPSTHNGGPDLDPIDAALAPWSNDIDEAQSWLDGEAITEVSQMDAVDALIKSITRCGVELEEARKATTGPLRAIWQAELDRWKPTTADIDLTKTKLLKLVAPVKEKLAAAEREKKRVAWQLAEDARLEAESLQAAALAEETNIDAQREADAAALTAKMATTEARKASVSDVKGMKTVHHHKVESGQKVIDWIIEKDIGAMQQFIRDYVGASKNKDAIDGVRTWKTRGAKA